MGDSEVSDTVRRGGRERHIWCGCRIVEAPDANHAGTHDGTIDGMACAAVLRGLSRGGGGIPVEAIAVEGSLNRASDPETARGSPASDVVADVDRVQPQGPTAPARTPAMPLRSRLSTAGDQIRAPSCPRVSVGLAGAVNRRS